MTDGARSASARRSTPAPSLPDFVAQFIRTEAAGGLALVTAAVVALVWANSPWRASYVSFWHTPLHVQIGSIEWREDLHHFVNDGLMALFFFVVGLEIKREVIRGELSDRRIAALPVFAAVGGMVVPAILYAAIAAGSPGSHGWGIPMATDIAFALGVLALLGQRAPSGLKLFLLALAIVDDIGAIVVIAIFYGGSTDLVAAGVALLGVLAWWLLHRLRVDWPPLYVALGIATWYATYKSGVHATIAGVALALTTPTDPIAPSQTVGRRVRQLSDPPTAIELRQMMVIARESVSPSEHLQELMHASTSFLVLPVFALANAGVALRSGMLDASGTGRVAAGVLIALVVGKVLGISAGAWLGVRTRVAVLPADLRWPHVVGAGALGGIGFTVSLFIADLAFADAALTDAARVAILTASLTSALVGVVILALAGPKASIRSG